MTKAYQSNLSLRRIDGTPPEPCLEELIDMASVYADAFAGSPWNEHTKCPAEGVFFGKETKSGEMCLNCEEAELVQAYPSNETQQYIKKELARPDSSLFLLEANKHIVGFTWGFAYDNPEQFAEEKYDTKEMQTNIINILGKYGIQSSFYYLSESAILDKPDLRGKGVSLQFHKVRLEVASEKGLPAIQRTSAVGPMYRTSQKSGMTQISGPEVIVDTRNRTFTRTGSYINNQVDIENEPRVLFFKKPE